MCLSAGRMLRKVNEIKWTVKLHYRPCTSLSALWVDKGHSIHSVIQYINSVYHTTPNQKKLGQYGKRK